MTKISEKQLILPALFLMDLSPAKALSTTELIQKLRDLLNPIGDDLTILSGRNDDKFSQKVRNLKSHKTFEKNDVARYQQGTVSITEFGQKILQENTDKLNYLLTNDFQWEDLKLGLDISYRATQDDIKVEVFDETITFQEGLKKIVEVKIYERSCRLRQIAIEHFTKDGEISCDACNFNYRKFYGEIGEGYIEIHHIKPIFKYENEELNKTIDKALMNVVPVCSNCHRMIHRRRHEPLSINYLTEQINKNKTHHRTLL